MNKFIQCCIGLIIIFIIFAAISGMSSQYRKNIEHKEITLADETKLGIPTDFTVTNPFSNYTDSDGFYYTNCQLESKDWGWVYIEYTYDPIETMFHGSNSTKATDADNDGILEFDVFDGDGHRFMKIRGDNPTIVESIGKTVKF